MPEETLIRMMRQIVPARLTITDIQGTWKVNQNKSAEARLAAAGHVARSPVGGNPIAIAALMRDPPA